MMLWVSEENMGLIVKIRNRIIQIIAPMLTVVSPELNTRLLFWQKFGRKLNLEDPKTLNEKILFLKYVLEKVGNPVNILVKKKS